MEPLRKIKRQNKYARPILTRQPRKKILGSISGGRSSGVMAAELMKLDKDWFEVKYCFMNTSRERNATLDFVEAMNRLWNLNIVWLEADINPVRGIGIRHRVTSYEKAKRDGEIFELWISKYGLPSVKNPGCSRDLKMRTCNSWRKSIGWEDSYVAIGFRRDEPKRVNFLKAEREKQIYPLYNAGIVKKDIDAFWDNQSFKLGIPDWMGNCKLCFKQLLRKQITILKYNPDEANWFIEMENKYPNHPVSAEPLSIFRGGDSIHDLIALSRSDFDDYVTDQPTVFDEMLDDAESCAESCEAF